MNHRNIPVLLPGAILLFAALPIPLFILDAFIYTIRDLLLVMSFVVLIPSAVAVFMACQKSTNWKSKLTFVLLNLISLTVGILLVVSSDFGQKQFQAHAIPLLQELPDGLQSLFHSYLGYLSTGVLFFAIATGNYLYYIRHRHPELRGHLPGVYAFATLFIPLYFLIPVQTYSLLHATPAIYMLLAVVGMVPPFFYFSDATEKYKQRKKGFLTGNTVLFALLPAYFLWVFVSGNQNGAFSHYPATPLFHLISVSILTMGYLHLLIAYPFVSDRDPAKSRPAALGVYALAVAYVLYYYYGQSSLEYLHILAFSLLFGSLLVVGTIHILRRHLYPVAGRLLYVAGLLLITLVSVWFLIEGSGLVEANRFGFKMNVTLLFALFFELSYVTVVLLHMNRIIAALEEKRRIAKKKAARKKSAASKKSAIKPPFQAYRGKGKYIFVSYSHRNMKEVFGILQKLFNQGYKIWYDEGIEPGDEWPETIGKAIEKCDHFVVFLSKPAARSRNVRNEINYAFNRKKKMSVVFLENTKLTHGLDLQIGTVQSIPRYEMSSQKFYQTLKKMLK